MPGVIVEDGRTLKRRHSDVDGAQKAAIKSRKAPKQSSAGSSTQEKIVELEKQILESPEPFSDIDKIQAHVYNAEKKPKTATLAAVALCRIFSRFIAGERLVPHRYGNAAEQLKQQLRVYTRSIAGWIGSPDATKENTALRLLMTIVKEETSQDSKRSEAAWRAGSTFVLVVQALMDETDAEGARRAFVENYVDDYDDVRFYTVLTIKQLLTASGKRNERHVSNAVDLLKRAEGIPESEDQLERWYGKAPDPQSHKLYSYSNHRKEAQECWRSIFGSSLTTNDRKTILRIMSSLILPWFTNRVETLADFLTDSFNTGGSISVLALGGIFHLMTNCNLDYPEFYIKLYSLLDDGLMHSKHRSRFYRHLDQFMNSSHLPAAMVASFIKRLSRLSLQAPPGAIVWVVPWIYNMMKKHPSCTFMLHRSYHPAHLIYASNPNYTEEGMDDLFHPKQGDPMLTNAIDSSLWELHTLQDHWHPNVATLAKILGEQFTKRDYHLEDFLDHTYASLVDAELGKEMKKLPEVEWEIPKRIVTVEDGGLNTLGTALWTAIEAS